MSTNQSQHRVFERKNGWYMHGHPGHCICVPKNGVWSFNGDMIRPTFSPSINEEGGHHFFVENGVVRYLNDKRAFCCEGQGEHYAIPPWSAPYAADQASGA